jgi:ATP-dependent DNA helicase RecG
MDSQALLTLIAQGENQAIEFKQTWPRPEQLAREIVAFANSGGGTILIGVQDDKQIVGLALEPQQEEWVINIARQSISPALNIKFEWIELEGQTVAAVKVPKGLDKPYQTADKYYIRVGSTNRSPTQAELMRLYQLAGVFHFDAVPIGNTSAADLNAAAIDDYFSRYGIAFTTASQTEREALLRNTDITTSSGESTVAGMLCFGINPSRHLPQAGVQFAHFEGLDVTGDLIDKQTITGTLSFQIDTALSLIKHNIKQPSLIEDAIRQDTQKRPSDKALRELLVNACVHRNYSITGSMIRVFMFDNRIECHSPGRLPNTITLEKLSSGVSYASNPVIVKFMDNMGYIDRLGRGFPTLYQEAARLGHRLEVKETGEALTVVMRY